MDNRIGSVRSAFQQSLLGEVAYYSRGCEWDAINPNHLMLDGESRENGSSDPSRAACENNAHGRKLRCRCARLKLASEPDLCLVHPMMESGEN